MARVIREGGVVLEFDDRVFELGTPKPHAARRGASPFDESPEPISVSAAVAPDTSAAQMLVDRLVARGVVTRAGDAIDLRAGAQAPADAHRAAPPAAPARLTVPLAEGEQAVVLVEGDGVLAWRFGAPAEPTAFAQARRGRSEATRALVFEIDIPPVAAPMPDEQRRGWIRDRLIDGAKAIVLYFAAEAAAAGAVRLLERKRRTGPVIVNSATDPGEWLRPDDFSALHLPSGRAARLLLLVHGTFSSTLGGFGELTATPWGQRLLAAALGRYDAVIGFDHRTMSQSPLANAHDLLEALRTLPVGQPIEIDAISHSRGGLVLRSLTEHLLPGAKLPVKVGCAIFVAATNHGTELARPDNWETLVDLVTNLAAVTNRVLSWFPATVAAAHIADEAIDCIGDFVKYLVEVAVTERQVPGIAAMDPSGPFVRELNERQPGQPTPAEISCYAIVSDFYAKLLEGGEHEPAELPKRLAFILADGVIDRLMRGSVGHAVPNDLVVDVASMTDIDAAVGGYVKDVLDFGRNPLVYHTNYFMRPETAGRLAQWLHLPSPVEGIDVLRLAGAQRGVASVRADATVAEVRTLIEREAPNFLVIGRPDPARGPGVLLHYAVKPDEFIAATRAAQPLERVIDAFGLHETDRTEPLDPQQLPFDGAALATTGARPHARRGVVLSRNQPMAVFEAGFAAADMRALGAMAAQMQAVTLSAPTRSLDRGALDDLFGIQRGGYGLQRSLPAANGGGRAASDAASVDTLPASAPSHGGPAATPTVRPPVPGRSVPARPSAAPGRAGAIVVEPEVAQVFATAEMPRQVALNRDAVVTVTLAAEHIEAALGNASDAGSFTPVAGEKLTVHVIPRRGFDYAVADPTNGRADVEMPRPGKPAILDFTLTANECGPGEVSVAVRQGAVRMLTLSLHAEVVETVAPRRGRVASSAQVEPGVNCGLCATLEIFDRRNAGQLQYEFILRAGDVSDRFKSEPIKIDPKAYVDARYREIETAWLGSNRAVDRFGQRLQSMGGQMFRELFPQTLKETLWRLANAGEIDEILVHSDDPFLPWEVVYIDDPKATAATGKGRFFGELGLCRWLFGAAPVCSIDVRPGKARYVVPHYPDSRWALAAAENIEEPMLKTQVGAAAVTPSHAEVVELLKRPGSFDLLHFACHGQADAERIDSAALLLQGEMVQAKGEPAWGKEMLLASTVAEFADLRGADGNRPLVVVNACQTGRLGYSLTGLGGFATAFLGTREGTGDSRGRAGAFVGALWSVGDQPASGFVTALYRELKAGKTIAQATRVGRAEARAAGDGSWLAYAIYAHPLLRVNFS